DECRRLASPKQFDWMRCIIDAFIAIMYARVATRELEASAGVAIRNIGFVVKHALSARRRAYRMFERWEAEFVLSSRIGPLFLVNYEWAKLLAHDGHVAEARRRTQMAIDSTAARPDSPARRDALGLLASLG